MVAENLALNADFFTSTAVSPNVSQNGVDFGEVSDASISIAGVGAGITYRG